MQDHAAVFRDGPSLKAGCDKLDVVWKDMENIKVSQSFEDNIICLVITCTLFPNELYFITFNYFSYSIMILFRKLNK